MQMHKRGERVSLVIGTFTDTAYWAFSELLLDSGWFGWAPLIRESKRKSLVQKFVKRCMTRVTSKKVV